MSRPSRRWLLSITCAILSLVAIDATRAGTVPAEDARITEVTVYRDRAETIREARVSLPPRGRL